MVAPGRTFVKAPKIRQGRVTWIPLKKAPPLSGVAEKAARAKRTYLTFFHKNKGSLDKGAVAKLRRLRERAEALAAEALEG